VKIPLASQVPAEPRGVLDVEDGPPQCALCGGENGQHVKECPRR
jgi:hypothetical protein